MIKYIFILAVLFALFYAMGFCIFYGISVEDWVFLLLAAFFAELLYLWNLLMQPAKNEYTQKLFKFLKKVAEEK